MLSNPIEGHFSLNIGSNIEFKVTNVTYKYDVFNGGRIGVTVKLLSNIPYRDCSTLHYCHVEKGKRYGDWVKSDLSLPINNYLKRFMSNKGNELKIKNEPLHLYQFYYFTSSYPISFDEEIKLNDNITRVS